MRNCQLVISFFGAFFFVSSLALIQVQIEKWLGLSIGDAVYPFLFVTLAALYLEIIWKFSFWQSSAPVRYISLASENWESSDLFDLSRYTSQLKQLGFVRLTDYTISPQSAKQPACYQSHGSISRLFVNSEEYCFAEVVKFGAAPAFCSIVSLLEDNWSVVVTDAVPTVIVAAESYAYFRLPKLIRKGVECESVDHLLQSHLTLRAQMSTTLDIASLKQTDVDNYFSHESDVRAE